MLRVNNEFYTWKELVDKYPDKYVVVVDAELGVAGEIKSGNLIAVCEDNEIDDFIISLYKEHKKFEYSRTTEGNWMGII